MSQYWYVSSFAVLLCALVYLLYRRGLVTSKCIKAALFLFRPGRSADKATVDDCTGWVSHAGRFSGGQTYYYLRYAPVKRGGSVSAGQRAAGAAAYRLSHPHRRGGDGWAEPIPSPLDLPGCHREV